MEEATRIEKKIKHISVGDEKAGEKVDLKPIEGLHFTKELEDLSSQVSFRWFVLNSTRIL